MASIFRAASKATGETMIGLRPRAFEAMSARRKNLRRAWLQHAASMIGPGVRPGR
jgi:hypothetical protein